MSNIEEIIAQLDARADQIFAEYKAAPAELKVPLLKAYTLTMKCATEFTREQRKRRQSTDRAICSIGNGVRAMCLQSGIESSVYLPSVSPTRSHHSGRRKGMAVSKKSPHRQQRRIIGVINKPGCSLTELNSVEEELHVKELAAISPALVSEKSPTDEKN